MKFGTSLFVVLVAVGVAAPAKAEVKVQVILEAFDLLGDPISEIPLGSDFELRAIVDDVRTSTPVLGPGGEDLFGVFSAYVRATYDMGPLSFVPGSLSVDSFFSDLDVRTDTSPGEIRAGGSTSSLQNPGNDPQLLWSATLHAEAVGEVTFSSFFENFPEAAPSVAEWLIYGDFDILDADNVVFSDLEVTIVPEPAGIVSCTIGLAAVGAMILRRRKAQRERRNHDG